MLIQMWLKWKIVVNFIIKLYVCMKNFSEGVSKVFHKVIKYWNLDFVLVMRLIETWLKTNYS